MLRSRMELHHWNVRRGSVGTLGCVHVGRSRAKRGGPERAVGESTLARMQRNRPVAAFWPETGRLEVLAAFPAEPTLRRAWSPRRRGNAFTMSARAVAS